jgi:hypothetical protein
MALYAAAFAVDFEQTLEASREALRRERVQGDPWERIERYPGLYFLGERAATIADLGVKALRQFEDEDSP